MIKKVTFCAYDKPNSIGGPVTWLKKLLPALQKRGVKVNCLILFHVGDTGPLYEHLVAHGIPCKTTVFKNYTEDNIRWILECLKKDPPDIFVPNLVVAAYLAVPWIKKSGVKTVGVSHSDDPFYHAIQNEFIDGDQAFRLDGIVVVSTALEKQLKASQYASQIKIKRIPYGVSVPDCKTERRGSKLRVVYVGRLAEEQKRISEVAMSFCKMTAQIPNTEAIFYGDGPDRRNVERIIEQQGKNLPVELAGSIPAYEVQNMLLDAHVIVLLSDFEGLPIAILEAMACGVVPVCLQMNSGISEQIIPGVTGFVVKDRSTNFIEVVQRLEQDKALWKSMSVNAKQFIIEHFTLEQSHENWYDLLMSFDTRELKPVRIPKSFRLPKVNSHLARADKRRPKGRELLMKRMKEKLVKFRMYLGQLKRRILN